MPPEAYAAMQEMQRRSMAGGTSGMPYGASGAAQTGNGIPDGHVVPGGSFAVEELTGNLFVWAHDDTVEPEKTYRYQMRYLLKNPLYRRTQQVNNPAMARTLAITSAPSKWTEPVTIPPTRSFFVSAGVAPGMSTVKFDVFRWQEGAWHQKGFTVTPGDMIGLTDDGTNFETGWTLVDLKTDPVRLDPRVIVADPEGNLMPRTFRDDSADEIGFKKDINWQDPNAVPKVPGMPGMGDMPGGMPGMYPQGGMPGMPGMPRTR
jgi:hypothetical protein